MLRCCTERVRPYAPRDRHVVSAAFRNPPDYLDDIGSARDDDSGTASASQSRRTL